MEKIKKVVKEINNLFKKIKQMKNITIENENYFEELISILENMNDCNISEIINKINQMQPLHITTIKYRYVNFFEEDEWNISSKFLRKILCTKFYNITINDKIENIKSDSDLENYYDEKINEIYSYDSCLFAKLTNKNFEAIKQLENDNKNKLFCKNGVVKSSSFINIILKELEGIKSELKVFSQRLEESVKVEEKYNFIISIKQEIERLKQKK